MCDHVIPFHAAIDPLAQAVEHLTFNQGVPGSIPGWITINVRRYALF